MLIIVNIESVSKLATLSAAIFSTISTKIKWETISKQIHNISYSPELDAEV